ncbi:hypothetical protein [Actinomyces vulturis]|uniref:hypothetical protein n=1 Tax=Actinomyces vulturis TaxID=1857645 RepID=UPI00082C5FE6|nr:hypothetical protein [Actinomyces vulturis]
MHPQNPRISRRTVTKGAAWSIPALIIATPAPATAISKERVAKGGAGVDIVAWGRGTASGTQLNLKIVVPPMTVPKHSSISWTISPAGGWQGNIPTGWYSLVNNPKSVEETFTITAGDQDIELPGGYIEWSSTNNLGVAPGTTIKVTESKSISPQGGEKEPAPGSDEAEALTTTLVKFVAPNRKSLQPMKMLEGKIGEVQFASNGAKSNMKACGENGADTSVVYTNGSCVNFATYWPKVNSGQKGGFGPVY